MPLNTALQTIRTRLFEAEAAHPESPELDALHKAMLKAVFNYGSGAGLTQAQIDALTAPEGGGTPKEPEEE